VRIAVNKTRKIKVRAKNTVKNDRTFAIRFEANQAKQEKLS